MANFHDKRRRTGIPGGVASGFESGPQTTTGERGCVWFLLNQRVAFKLFDGSSIAFDGKKGIVFFGSGACEWLKPVCKVRYTPAFGPSPHAVGNLISHGAVYFFTTFNTCNKAF